MTSKQARLVAAVSDAMAAQNFSQNNLARTSGVGQSMISAALLGKYDLKEEKWRMICETLALDYDDIIADVELPPSSPCGESTSLEREAEQESAHEETRGVATVLLREQTKEDRDNLFLLAMYAEARLSKDIEAGMKVDPMKLWGILDALKKIKDNTLQPE